MGEKPLDSLSLVANADLSAHQYDVVKGDTSVDRGIVLANAGEKSIGIMQDAPTLGQTANVMTLGLSWANLGGTVTRFDDLTPDANGQLVLAGDSDYVLAMALDSGVAGDCIEVYLLGRHSAYFSSVVSFYIPNAEILNGDLYNFTPDFTGSIEKILWSQGTPVTTPGRSADISLEILGVPVTGGVVGLTSANCAVPGAEVTGSAITAGNAFTSGDQITIRAANVVVFAEGMGHVVLILRG